MGHSWRDFDDFAEVEGHREALDFYFGPGGCRGEPGYDPTDAYEPSHPASTGEPTIELPATMDEILERRNGTDEDPEGRFQ